MSKTICAYCSSSTAVDAVYIEAARALGVQIARRGWALIYGGGHMSLMGALARAAQEGGGHVTGVIPAALHRGGHGYRAADELLVTGDLRDRKALMESRSDAFITLPGGFGTLEEALEIITLKQLGDHNKAIVFLNVNGFFDPLFAMFERLFAERFAKETFRQLYHIAPDAEGALAYIEAYQPVELERKWF